MRPELLEVVMSQPPRIDPLAPSAEEDHARVTGMLSSPEMQRRLEVARVQRARVLAEREASRAAALGMAASPLALDGPPGTSDTERAPEKRTARAAEAVSLVRAGLLDSLEPTPALAGPAAPVAVPQALRTSSRPIRTGQAGRFMRLADATHLDRRPSWVLSLLIGLVVGLTIGAGLTWFAVTAPPFSLAASRAAEVINWARIIVEDVASQATVTPDPAATGDREEKVSNGASNTDEVTAPADREAAYDTESALRQAIQMAELNAAKADARAKAEARSSTPAKARAVVLP